MLRLRPRDVPGEFILIIVSGNLFDVMFCLQDDGSCLCDYGYIWQGPLAETSDVGEKEPISPFPTVLYGFFYQEKYHTCAARHPCNMNGESCFLFL